MKPFGWDGLEADSIPSPQSIPLPRIRTDEFYFREFPEFSFSRDWFFSPSKNLVHANRESPSVRGRVCIKFQTLCPRIASLWRSCHDPCSQEMLIKDSIKQSESVPLFIPPSTLSFSQSRQSEPCTSFSIFSSMFDGLAPVTCGVT